MNHRHDPVSTGMSKSPATGRHREIMVNCQRGRSVVHNVRKGKNENRCDAEL